ncbi:MAG: hypothetical protein JO048_17060 [Methylobacteriaceae bacterium]|nr:hypothetical protein [Methylobacteriaceae bacterium]
MAVLLGAGPALAQRADGTYPATLACDAAPGARGVLRAPATVEIGAGRARYSIRSEGGTETGSGTLDGRQLVLSGRGRGYEARYAGEVRGQGGLLTGSHTGAGGTRRCQLLIGDGRG